MFFDDFGNERVRGKVFVANFHIEAQSQYSIIDEFRLLKEEGFSYAQVKFFPNDDRAAPPFGINLV